MEFIKEHIMLIVCVLLALIVIIEGIIICVQHKKLSHKEGQNANGSSDSLSEDDSFDGKCAEKCEIYKQFSQKNEDCKKANIELSNYENKIEELNEEKESLKQELRELKRENDELNKREGREPAPYGAEDFPRKSKSKDDSADDVPTQSSQFHAQEIHSSDVVQEPNEESKSDSAIEPKAESPKEMIMYASFPRSAASSIYFSDLSENRADDSYFELKVNIASDKATFKPLDFMRIRNYDSAMAAMLTEGVKPNVASTVLGIESGKAHKEGRDWIIDNPAKIKLA